MTVTPRKIRLLTQTLILSGVLNALLLALLALFVFPQHPLPLSFSFQPQARESQECALNLADFETYSYADLVEKLEDPKTRAIALTVLMQREHVDLARALGKKHISLVALREADFEKIASFLKTERWPLTSAGLFAKIKEKGSGSDPTLFQAFSLTPEFQLVERLFRRWNESIKRSTILTLLYEGHWETLASFYKQQSEGCDLSQETYSLFLTEYMQQGSKTAEKLLKAKEVAGRTGDLEPLPRDKELRPLFRQQPPASPPTFVHVIQPGESLWTISQKYHIPIETLMQQNGLRSTVIHPGKTLKIQGRGS